MGFALTGLFLFALVGVPLLIAGWVIISDYAQEICGVNEKYG